MCHSAALASDELYFSCSLLRSELIIGFVFSLKIQYLSYSHYVGIKLKGARGRLGETCVLFAFFLSFLSEMEHKFHQTYEIL